MKPPLVARALVAAVTAPSDYENISGDLYEEYMLRVQSSGRKCGDMWYWSQALRSIPSLLSYSRTQLSPSGTVKNALLVVCVLSAMLAIKGFVDQLIDCSDPRTWLSEWLYLCIDWSVAAGSGALLGAVVRSQGVRLALFSSVFLVSAFAFPIVLGVSPRLPAEAWVLLLGAIPAMSAGAAGYQVVRRMVSRLSHGAG